MTLPHDEERPKKLRSSPTGRVPQWAMDEALGRDTEPVPFRGPVSGGGKRSDRRFTLRSFGVVLLVVSVGAAAFYFKAPASLQAPLVATSQGDSTRPPPGRDEQPSPLGRPPSSTTTTEGAGFRYLAHQTGTAAPVTWSPCRPIRYVTRQVNTPTDGASALASALGQVSYATGLKFVDAGMTTEGPSSDRAAYQPDRYGKRWAPVLIAWATSAEVPDFGVDVAGESGASSVQTPEGATYVSGIVYLDPAKFAQIEATQGYATAKAVILHELGHLVGLAHVSERDEIMFPSVGVQVTTYGPGDIGGLAAVGRGPCRADV